MNFIFTFLFTLFCWLLLLFDQIYGDSNGSILGINLSKINPTITVAFVAYSIWYGYCKKIKWLQNTLLGLFSATFFIVVIEFICGKLIEFKTNKGPKIEGPIHLLSSNDTIGYVPVPNSKIKGIRKADGREIYNISFETDKNSLRKTPIDTTGKNYHALFFWLLYDLWRRGAK